MTVLEDFGVWAADVDAAAVPSEALADHVLDTLGAWLAGSATDDGKALARLCTGQAGVPGLAEHPLDRLLRRVGQTRLTEIDDIHLPSCTTPGSVVVITALTLASALDGVAAREFAASLRAGYGAMTWLGCLVNGARVFYRGVWPTYYVTPMGAAAVAARLLGLDAGRIADAAAIALTASSAGIGAPPGTTPRWLLIGQAARAGCVAAMAAANGYSGDRALLDGDWLARVHGLEIDGQVALLPPRDGGVSALSMKPICAARQTQSAIAAFRQLLLTGIDPAEIEAIQVAVQPNFVGLIDHSRTGSRMGRITSIGYLLALAAYQPSALYDVARSELVSDARFTALMECVTVVADATLDRHYPQRWPATVTLRLANGRTLCHSIVDAPGDPTNALGAPELREKFRRLASQSLSGEAASRLEAACLGSTTSDSALASLCTQIAHL